MEEFRRRKRARRKSFPLSFIMPFEAFCRKFSAEVNLYEEFSRRLQEAGNMLTGSQAE